MNRFLLFFDTETSGLPKQLEAPDLQKGDWPHALQVSWILYSPEGGKIREENHYIYDAAVTISPASFRVHGITNDFLRQNGKDRLTVMSRLQADLLAYQPLVIGHFMELDQYLAMAEFDRCGLDNPLESLPVFCTMLGNQSLVRNPRQKYLKLAQLYELLFDRAQTAQHNALSDAQATAECFFALRDKGLVSDAAIEQQPRFQTPVADAMQEGPWSMLVLGLMAIAAIVVYFIYE